jgi:Tol biopolymer transport system component
VRIHLAIAATAALTLACVPAANAAYPTAGNGRIVFSSTRDTMTDYQIFVMGADGSNPVNLTPGAPNSADPNFSPDGRRILFGRINGPGNFDIFSMNADGTGLANLTQSNPTNDTTTAYSPDGKRISFARDVDPTVETNFDIFIANADGSGATNLTPNRTTTQEGQPDFSPDGKRIIFNTAEGGDADMFAMGVDGSNQVNLTPDSTQGDFDGVFTPDGKRIALARDVDPTGGQDLDIVLINSTTGTGAVDILPGPNEDRYPAPSPDGARIAFQRANDVYVAPIDGSGAANLTPDPGFNGTTPRWEYVYSCAGRRATMIGTDSADKIKGTKGADVIVGNGGNDKLLGRGGKDRICGGPGADKLKGGAGNDRLLGQAGKDQLTGGKGDDVLKGGKGKDVQRQ